MLQADTIQQLEVALLGLPVAKILDLLSEGLVQAKGSTSFTPAQPHPRIYTSTHPAPPPSSVPVVGVSTTSPKPAIVSAMELMSSVDEPTPPKAKGPKISIEDLPYHCITPTPVGSSSSSVCAGALPVVVVPELAIPAEEYPEQINRPSGGKDYLCNLCPFRHSI